MSEALEAIDPHADLIASLIGVTISDRYVVERLLGRGGMGLVLEARHRELDQKVAIKVILPEFAANGVVAARFMREAKVAARVTGRHLVRVFDVGRLPSGMPYLVMELLSGNDLDVELTRRGPLPVEEAVDHIVQAALGLAELHAQGVVHRDLKPSNLFISTADGDRTIKILDFGISKEAPGHVGALTGTDTAIGTPSYMSPEQIKTPKEVDIRADIWSLGVILAELLTQALPFPTEGASVGELFGIILFREPVAPVRRRPDLPPGLSDVVMRCLRKDRDERYRDVAELAEALRPFASSACQYRIDAVRRAVGPLTAKNPTREAEGHARRAADGVSTTIDPPPMPDVQLAHGPTQLSAADPLAPTAISRPAVFAVGVTGRSLVSSTRNLPLDDPERSTRSRLVFALIAAVALVGGSAVLVLRSGSTPAVLPNAASVAPPLVGSAPPEQAPLVSPVVSSEPVVPPIASAAAPSSSSARGAAGNAKPRSHGKPVARPAGADDLILDRR